jgi:hypothetical protein
LNDIKSKLVPETIYCPTLGGLKPPAFQAAASAFLFLYLQQLRCLWQYVVSTAFIRDFLIGEADIASFSCYSKPPDSAGGAFTDPLWEG